MFLKNDFKTRKTPTLGGSRLGEAGTATDRLGPLRNRWPSWDCCSSVVHLFKAKTASSFWGSIPATSAMDPIGPQIWTSKLKKWPIGNCF
jgi:hypothetical protein